MSRQRPAQGKSQWGQAADRVAKSFFIRTPPARRQMKSIPSGLLQAEKLCHASIQIRMGNVVLIHAVEFQTHSYCHCIMTLVLQSIEHLIIFQEKF